MIEDGNFLDLVEAAFPAEPLPTVFFWPERRISFDDDIAQELRSRLSGRPWTGIALKDWSMVGVPISVSRSYLKPATFMYYAPSVIVGVSQEFEYLEVALEAIIPENKNHMPRGQWWFEFAGSTTPHQRAAIFSFLAHVRLTFWDAMGPANQYLLECAENIWSS
jgi:hypothetical protein